ncbi:MAG: single-stranded-DNA-specific exonuclease RecJ [Terracidiphilus sp.]
MFLCQPLLDILIARGIEDIDSFIQPPSWSDLPDPDSISGMTGAVDRVLAAVRDKRRIAIFGDYDCDGILGTHILRSVLAGLGVQARAYLPHRDEGYGLSSCVVHKFSLCGTDLLITVDNGINAQREILLAQRLGVDVIVVDHHRIQEQANTLAVWSQEFCGAGLAALFAMTLAQRAGWKDDRVERLQAAMSQYAAIASVADCVPLQNGTRTLARLGMRELARAENCGLRELLRMSCADPANPDSNDLAFGVAPRINAAGRIDHPARALSVFEAARDEDAARRSVELLDQLNQQRRQLVAAHFGSLCTEIPLPAAAALVLYRETCPKGIAGLLAAKCVERFKVPTIVLAPAPEPGLVVGSGRSVAGFDLAEALEQFRRFFRRFGGHAQAIGLTMPASQIEAFAKEFTTVVEGLNLDRNHQIREDGELVLATVGEHFDEQLALLEPFGEGNPAPIFLLRTVEIGSLRNRWVRIRQGRYSLEALCWDLCPKVGTRGDCLIEFRGKRRILRHFREAGAVA